MKKAARKSSGKAAPGKKPAAKKSRARLPVLLDSPQARTVWTRTVPHFTFDGRLAPHLQDPLVIYCNAVADCARGRAAERAATTSQASKAAHNYFLAAARLVRLYASLLGIGRQPTAPTARVLEVVKPPDDEATVAEAALAKLRGKIGVSVH